MAGYRQFYTKFWKDEWVIELTPLERYLFSYLFTNELASISGIYKIPLRIIVFETGLEKDFILQVFDKFQKEKKIFYKDGVMWVVNILKHHKNASPQTMVKVNKDIADVPDCDVKRAYLHFVETGEYSIDTVSIHESQRERERENKKEKESEPIPLSTSTSGMSFTDADLLILDDVFQKVTGFYPPKEVSRVRETIRLIAKNNNLTPTIKDKEQIIKVLKPFYESWSQRKNKRGKPYSKLNLVWLFEWAATGDIPEVIEVQEDSVFSPNTQKYKDPNGVWWVNVNGSYVQLDEVN